jgi:site-specific DNA-methyltransferase (cytosine-N4-specific)
MIRLNRRGVKPTLRPSGHVIKKSFDKVDVGGAIPPNVIEEAPDENGVPVPESMLKFGNNAANDEYAKRSKALGLKMHPARFPSALPEFFIRFLTEPKDVVIDPFAGSNTTGVVAEQLGRQWVAMEKNADYLLASKVRFTNEVNTQSAARVAQRELF